jgi:hypothetical protein
MKKPVVFVCRFSKKNALDSIASSAAGDLVQQKIIIESKKILNDNFYYISMPPNQSWPKGDFFIKKQDDLDGTYVSYVNLPIVKNMCMMFWIFYYYFTLNPKIIFQYNSYFFENVAILSLSRLFGMKNFIIMQDYRNGELFSYFARIFDKTSNYLVKYFDLCIPVTQKFSNFLKIPKEKSIIFIGGITEPAQNMLEVDFFSEDCAIFAGALEAHNGIDQILESWSKLDTRTILHVFGRGTFSQLVQSYSDDFENIVFHGFVKPEIVSDWQKKSKFNICLRYSIGIDQDYFFPSKFFNTACCYGLLIINDFNNKPDYFNFSCGLVKSDFSNLLEILNIDNFRIEKEAIERRQAITELNSWNVILKKCFDILELNVEQHES